MIRRQTEQNKAVLELIKAQPSCIIQTQYLQNIDKVSTNIVKTILEQTFINSIDMKAVLCLFNTFLKYSRKPNSKEEPYELNSTSVNWLNNMEIVSVSSVYGTAFVSTIIDENIKVILKVTKQGRGNAADKKRNESELYREYILGVNALNKLRYYVPTLAYVLGIFKCLSPTTRGNVASNLCKTTGRGEKTPYVIYEMAKGPSVSNIFRLFQPGDGRDVENFKKILEIFVQILITLEIAQREYSFTHFDLHISNVMSKSYLETNPLQYDVSIDDKTYQITTTTVPVIIDYGASSAKINNKVYGSEGKENVGIMNHMIPGFDMYRFLADILNSLERKVRGFNQHWNLLTDIKELFRFYGTDDYYNILIYGAGGAGREYSSKVSTTKLATYTPGMFLNWILDPTKPYSAILGNVVQIKERRVYMPIHTSILINEYNKIFSEFDQGKTEAVNIIKNCFKISPSYLINRYNIHVLFKYNKEADLNDTQITQAIASMEEIIEEPSRKKKMIEVDIIALEDYFNIRLITPEDIENAKKIIPILRSRKQDRRRYSTLVNKLYYFKQSIQPYLQYFYTIKEVGLDSLSPYSEWIEFFEQGDIYEFYVNYIKSIDRFIRWNEVLNKAL